MTIIEPEVQIVYEKDKVAHVAKCARVCYGRDKGNDKVLYENLEKNGHLSMFRHETYYAAIPITDTKIYDYALKYYFHCPYLHYFTYKDKVYIITNGQVMRELKIDNPYLYNKIIDNEITETEAIAIPEIQYHHARYTFIITTQISTSRELNRVSPNNISERSTRYVLEDGSICRPHWMQEREAELINTNQSYLLCDITSSYKKGCEYAINRYIELVKEYCFKREDARGVLPLDTATKCVYTYSVDEWKHIIDLRYYGTTGKPHPNAKNIINMVRLILTSLDCGIK